MLINGFDFWFWFWNSHSHAHCPHGTHATCPVKPLFQTEEVPRIFWCRWYWYLLDPISNPPLLTARCDVCCMCCLYCVPPINTHGSLFLTTPFTSLFYVTEHSNNEQYENQEIPTSMNCFKRRFGRIFMSTLTSWDKVLTMSWGYERCRAIPAQNVLARVRKKRVKAQTDLGCTDHALLKIFIIWHCHNCATESEQKACNQPSDGIWSSNHEYSWCDDGNTAPHAESGDKCIESFAPSNWNNTGTYIHNSKYYTCICHPNCMAAYFRPTLKKRQKRLAVVEFLRVTNKCTHLREFASPCWLLNEAAVIFIVIKVVVLHRSPASSKAKKGRRRWGRRSTEMCSQQTKLPRLLCAVSWMDSVLFLWHSVWTWCLVTHHISVHYPLVLPPLTSVAPLTSESYRTEWLPTASQ